MVSASSGVSVLMLPLPRLTPLRDAAPAWTTMLSTPVLVKSARIADQAPLPISAMASSDPTPMMMPSVVRAERMALRRSERMAVEVVRAKKPQVAATEFCRRAIGRIGPRWGQLVGSIAPAGSSISRLSAAVLGLRIVAASASSSKTSPSRIRMMRPAWAATVGSCVTRTMVSPSSRLSWRKRSRISSPVFESRLPVGSSAIRREQRLMSARAIATRCCSPPESRAGS